MYTFDYFIPISMLKLQILKQSELLLLKNLTILLTLKITAKCNYNHMSVLS